VDTIASPGSCGGPVWSAAIAGDSCVRRCAILPLLLALQRFHTHEEARAAVFERLAHHSTCRLRLPVHEIRGTSVGQWHCGGLLLSLSNRLASRLIHGRMVCTRVRILSGDARCIKVHQRQGGKVQLKLPDATLAY
jgi:hypothetical protein